jgi:hypothetical protein
MIFLNGCALWKELNTPVRKTRKTKQVKNPTKPEPTTLPDGSTIGYNDYEKAYIKSIDRDFERQKAENSKKVFGGLQPKFK